MPDGHEPSQRVHEFERTWSGWQHLRGVAEEEHGRMRHIYIRAPQWLYDLRHPLLAPKWQDPPAFRWYHAAALAVVEAPLHLIERWNMRPAMKRMKKQLEEMERLNRDIEALRASFGLAPTDSPSNGDEK